MLNYKIEGKSKAEINVEIRFNIADAKAENEELVELEIKTLDDELQNKKRTSCINSVLSTMKREGLLQFFATPKDFSEKAAEAEFLKNKFPDLLNQSNEEIEYFYVKTK